MNAKPVVGLGLGLLSVGLVFLILFRDLSLAMGPILLAVIILIASRFTKN